MLVCFGASWPFSIAKTLRTKVVRGKSPVFLSLIMIGYVAGIGKMIALWRERGAEAAAAGAPVPGLHWLFWFYLALLCLVSLDAALYLKYRKNQK